MFIKRKYIPVFTSQIIFYRYMVFYIAVSITGSFVSEIVYCFHLLDVIDRAPTL